jgi:hypothetical protein
MAKLRKKRNSRNKKNLKNSVPFIVFRPPLDVDDDDNNKLDYAEVNQHHYPQLNNPSYAGAYYAIITPVYEAFCTKTKVSSIN